MATIVLTVDPADPDPAAIARAADVIRAGGLVAFPTETVYGLGANALDAEAVGRIYTAKGRPAQNPVIVHVSDKTSAQHLAAEWTAPAHVLADRFWPGPLTLVLPRVKVVPGIVTAEGSTVGLRVPAHPVALALLRACRLPVAAPSANRSSRVSPTHGKHVLDDLGGRIDMLLDAGPTTGGLESTVLDMTSTPPRVLRPGLVSRAEIEAVIGPIEVAQPDRELKALKSPGLLERHYAPATPLECVSEDRGAYAVQLRERGVKVGWLTFASVTPNNRDFPTILLPGEPEGYGAGLYAALRELDGMGLDRILVALPPQADEWLAVHDRLRRAATQ